MSSRGHRSHEIAHVWTRGSRRPARLLAVSAVVGLVAVAACASSAGEPARPSCNEELQATGQGLPVAPGIAIAVSYQIEVSNRELGRVIDAAVEYHGSHPQYVDLDNVDDEVDVIGGGETSYVGALLVLAERPELATPAILDALEAEARDGGIPGVGNAVRHAMPGDPAPYGSDRFLELAQLVRERRSAVENSDLVPLPARQCLRPEDDE